MKYIYITILGLALAACSNNNDIYDAYGNFESDATIISAENSGKLIYFNTEEGATIKEGDTVALIDTSLLSLKKEQLKASFISINAQSESVLSQISVLKQQLKVQQSDLKRIQKMYSDGAATKKQLDDAQGRVDITKSQISSVEAQNASVLSQFRSLNVQIAQIEDQINKSIIVNPINGTVLGKYAEAHEFVAPGKPLYKIQDISNLKLKAYIVEPQLTEIKIGQQVKVVIDSLEGDVELDGTISWVSNYSEFTPKNIQTKDERQNLVYAIKIDVKNDGRLKIGMPASVIF